MFANLREDINRAMYQARPDGWKPSLFQRIEVCLRHGTLPVIAYRFGHWTLGVRIPVIGQLLHSLRMDGAEVLARRQENVGGFLRFWQLGRPHQLIFPRRVRPRRAAAAQRVSRG